MQSKYKFKAIQIEIDYINRLKYICKLKRCSMRDLIRNLVIAYERYYEIYSDENKIQEMFDSVRDRKEDILNKLDDVQKELSELYSKIHYDYKIRTKDEIDIEKLELHMIDKPILVDSKYKLKK